MTILRMNVGARIVASFALVLAIMAGMTAVALWRLQAADASTASLVRDKLARRQLDADILAGARLNGLRAAALARSDSLEVAEYFTAQLATGDRAQAALEARLSVLVAQDPDPSAGACSPKAPAPAPPTWPCAPKCSNSKTWASRAKWASWPTVRWKAASRPGWRPCRPNWPSTAPPPTRWRPLPTPSSSTAARSCWGWACWPWRPAPPWRSC